MKKAILLLSIALVFCAFALDINLANTLANFDKKHPEATLGFYSTYEESDEPIAAHNSEKNLAPASTLKVLTTASALEILGADYKFETSLFYNGTIEGTSLKGDLIIVPSGDPSTGSSYFEHTDVFATFTEKIKAKGIESIKGKIILDMRGFSSERVPPSWSFDDLGNYYGASVAPLNWHDNRALITFSSGGAGSQTKVLSIHPSIPDLEIKNEVLAANIRYDNAYVFGAPSQYNRAIRGEIPANKKSFSIKASVPEPELFAMQQFVSSLRANGIKVPSGAISFNAQPLAVGKLERIHVYYSPTIAQIVEVTNIESNNQFAEALLRAIGKKEKNDWNTKAGVSAIKEFWEKQNVELSSANLYDGSGLSRFNGISAKQICAILQHMAGSTNFLDFKKSLPIAGRSGSIKGMFKGSQAENNLCAKSGYIDKVRSYCGYTKTATGKVAAFSIIVNGYKGSAVSIRNELEQILIELTESN